LTALSFQSRIAPSIGGQHKTGDQRVVAVVAAPLVAKVLAEPKMKSVTLFVADFDKEKALKKMRLAGYGLSWQIDLHAT